MYTLVGNCFKNLHQIRLLLCTELKKTLVASRGWVMHAEIHYLEVVLYLSRGGVMLGMETIKKVRIDRKILTWPVVH